ncbi:MAG: hypothetical protein ABIK32_07445 [Chloroflexota bacterium]
MLTKKLVVFIAATFVVAIVFGILALLFVSEDNGDMGLSRTERGITLIADPVVNSGTEPILAWTLDLGKNFYLINAEPAEVFYHKGHAQSAHGNVLVYADPIEPGDIFHLKLNLRVLFDSAGNFDSNPELRLSYARGTKDAQTLAVSDLQRFQDTFVTFPFPQLEYPL